MPISSGARCAPPHNMPKPAGQPLTTWTAKELESYALRAQRGGECRAAVGCGGWLTASRSAPVSIAHASGI
jgi:hypothetical protein